MPPSTLISISRADDLPDCPADAQLDRWCRDVLEALDTSGHIDIRLMGSDEIRALNHQYRQRDQATNVLSFPAEMSSPIPVRLLGDIAACAEVIARQAREQNKPLEHHWAHMITHAVLHLLGHDHIDPDQAEQMEQLERDLLARWSIPDPYQDRSSGPSES